MEIKTFNTVAIYPVLRKVQFSGVTDSGVDFNRECTLESLDAGDVSKLLSDCAVLAKAAIEADADRQTLANALRALEEAKAELAATKQATAAEPERARAELAKINEQIAEQKASLASLAALAEKAKADIEAAGK